MVKETACNVGDLGLIPGLERPLEKGMATLSSILAWRIPMDRGAWQATWGCKESDTNEQPSTALLTSVQMRPLLENNFRKEP